MLKIDYFINLFNSYLRSSFHVKSSVLGVRDINPDRLDLKNLMLIGFTAQCLANRTYVDKEIR